MEGTISKRKTETSISCLFLVVPGSNFPLFALLSNCVSMIIPKCQVVYNKGLSINSVSLLCKRETQARSLFTDKPLVFAILP
jgi:hypothetical protein